MSDRDLDTEYVSEGGDVIRWENVGWAMRYEPNIVESTENGYIIAGTEYTPK